MDMYGINGKKDFELQHMSLFGLPRKEDCFYTSCYCEENVWHLCKKIVDKKENQGECYCVFVSNKQQRVIFWNHKCSGSDHYVEWVSRVDFTYVFNGIWTCKSTQNWKMKRWDYHVLALYGSKKGYFVLDLDSLLPFPIPFSIYVEKTFNLDNKLPVRIEKYPRYFRVIPSKTFLEKFSSDRRHMRNGNAWTKQPPKYPPICKDSVHNLDDFINMDAKKGFGTVMEYEQFVSKFSTL